MYWHQSHQLSPFKSITSRQVAFTHDFAEILRRLFLLWRHNFVTWPDPANFFFHQKFGKGCPISYGKFQHDPPNGVASSSEKLMGGGLHQPPLHGRGLRFARKRSDCLIWVMGIRLCVYVNLRPAGGGGVWTPRAFSADGEKTSVCSGAGFSLTISPYFPQLLIRFQIWVIQGQVTRSGQVPHLTKLYNRAKLQCLSECN